MGVGGEVGERGRGWATDIVGVGTEIVAYLPKLVSPVSQADESIFLISERVLATAVRDQYFDIFSLIITSID